MTDQSRTNTELLEENALLKQRIQKLEQSEVEHKRTEEALRESAARFRELAELLPETVFEMDMRGTLTFVNRSAFDRFGYTQEEFARGLNVLAMVVPDDRGRASENIRRIINGETIGSKEYVMQRKDGIAIPSMIRSTAIIRDGKLPVCGDSLSILRNASGQSKRCPSSPKSGG